MSPEQLEGKDVDVRTDIFALDSVLYEMATVKKAFTGKSQASLITAILHDEPAPISLVQPLAPPALDHVLKRCLAKDPEERWQNAYDVASELKWIAEGASQVGTAPVVMAIRKKTTVGLDGCGVSFFLTSLALVFALLTHPPAAQELVHFLTSPPKDYLFRGPEKKKRTR